MSTNPFLAPDNPFVDPPAQKGFTTPVKVDYDAYETPEAAVGAAMEKASNLPPCGDPTCSRPHRPNGDHYSSDPSVRTKALIEDGKMGKQFGVLGGAKKKSRKRAAELIAESAAEDAEKIRQVFRDGIDPSNPIGVRLQAAKEYIKVENDEEDRSLAERQAEFDAMNKEQLVGSIQEMLQRLNAAGAIAGEVEEMTDEEEIVDAEVIED